MSVNPYNPHKLRITLLWNTEPSSVTPITDRLVTLRCKNHVKQEPANILEAGSRVIAWMTRYGSGLMTPIDVYTDPHILDAVLELIKKGTIYCDLDRPDDLILLASELKRLRIHPPGVHDEYPEIRVRSETYAFRFMLRPFIRDIKLIALDGGEVRTNRRMLRARSKKLETYLKRGDLFEFPLHFETKEKLTRFINFMQWGSAKLRVWNYCQPNSEFEEFCQHLKDFEVIDRGHGEELHETSSPLVYSPHEATKSNSETYRGIDHPGKVSGVPTVSYTDRQSKSDIHQIFQGNSVPSSRVLQQIYGLALKSPLASQLFPHQPLHAQQQGQPIQHQVETAQHQARHLHHRKEQVQQQLPQISHSSHSSQDTQENYQREYIRSSEEYPQNQNIHYLSDIRTDHIGQPIFYPEKNNLSQTQSHETVGRSFTSPDLSHEYPQYPYFSFSEGPRMSHTLKETSSLLPREGFSEQDTQRPSVINPPPPPFRSFTPTAFTKSSQDYPQYLNFPFLQDTGISHTLKETSPTLPSKRYSQQDAQNPSENNPPPQHFRSPMPSVSSEY